MVLKEVIIDFTALYICVSIVRKSQKWLIYKFLQKVNTLYWVSTDPGRDSVSHIKVTICTGWSPKILAC